MTKGALTNALNWWACRHIKGHEPNHVIGSRTHGAYMLRWYILPRNRVMNIYLHEIVRSDHLEEMHDHPWPNLSWVLDGSYVEHALNDAGLETRERLSEGDIRFRRAGSLHRIEIDNGPAISLFFTGPKLRRWGFKSLKHGWRPWRVHLKENQS